jgi:hypothetical protein
MDDMLPYATKTTKFPPEAFTIELKATRGSVLSTGCFIAFV